MVYQKKTLVHTSICFLLLCLVYAHSSVSMAQNSGNSADQNLPSYKFGGFLQQQFTADQTPGLPPRFSIHRARLGVSGTITNQIQVNLIAGYSEPPANTPRLVNVFVDFDIHPLLQLRTGQFLLPFGLEGPMPIFLNSAIERTLVIRRMNTFTMFRDVGIQLSGTRESWSYAVALVNGAGANNVEQVDPKDVMGRVGYKPIEDIQIGVSGHLGSYQPNPTVDDTYSRNRVGVDIGYNGPKVFLLGEYQWRRDKQPFENQLLMNGGYLLTGYRFQENLEAVARYEYFKPDTSTDNNLLNVITIGGSYYFKGNTRISVNYEFIDDQQITSLGNKLTVQMQVTL